MAKDCKYKYLVDGYGDDPDGAVEFDSDWDISKGTHCVRARWVAQDAAEDFHSNGDGWESSWPRTFTILLMDGTFVGKYEVEREAEPVFYAYPVKELSE